MNPYPQNFVLTGKSVHLNIILFFEKKSTNKQILRKAVNYYFKNVLPQVTTHEFVHLSNSMFTYDLDETTTKLRLKVSFDHTLTDALACMQFTETIAKIYNHLADPKLYPPLIINQFPAIEFKQTQTNDLEYWANLLNRTVLPNFFTEKNKNHQVKSYTFSIKNPTPKAIKQLAFKYRTTPFLILSAVLGLCFYRLYNAQHFLLAYSANMRPPGHSEQFGCYTNPIPMKFTITQNTTFIDLLQDLTQQRKATKQHQHVPFYEIIKYLRQNKLLLEPVIDLPLISETILSPLKHIKFTKTHFSYRWQATDTGNSFALLFDLTDPKIMRFRINYLSQTKAFIQAFSQHFLYLLESLLAYPEAKIQDISLLAPQERYKIIYTWNQTQKKFPLIKPVYTFFEMQAQKKPHEIALAYNNKSMSYQQLNERANQLARAILEQLPPGTYNPIIPICAEHSFEMIIGILAVLKAGGAYLPINPEWPENKIIKILNEVTPPFILLQEQLLALFVNYPTISINKNYQQLSGTNLNLDIDMNALCYIIYTSGSTGLPKAIPVQNNNLCYSTLARLSFYGNSKINCLLTPPFYFDSSIALIFWTLSVGGKLIVPPSLELNSLKTLLHKNKNLCLLTTPSIYNTLLDQYAKSDLLNFKKVIAAGETLRKILAKKHFKKCDAKLYNEYGPTETTVWATACEIKPLDKTISIGRPIANTTCYILDENLNPVPIGVTGELYIGGRGVTHGYLNRPDLTMTRFISNPFATPAEQQQGYNTRIYKTGDLARWLPDGNIEYIGRADFQVKIRGIRIELGEIESNLLRYPGINQALVLVKGTDEHKHLVAYYVSNNGVIDSLILQEFLNKHLPEYMVPEFFVVVKEMPLNANGKIDRNALPVINLDKNSLAMPKTATEIKLAKLWAKTLNLKAISADANFFQLGGHSLAAIKLVHDINQSFDTEYMAGFVFEHKILQEQARIINAGQKHKKYQAVVPLNQAANNFKPGQTPLILVHPAVSGVEVYSELVTQLPADLPIFGIDSYNLHHKKPIASIERLAQYYAQSLQQAINTDQFILGGWSLGGNIAFAMAQQMLQQATGVPLLLMIDSFNTSVLSNSTITKRFSVMKKVHICEYQNTALTPIESIRRNTLFKLENQMLHDFKPQRYDGPTLLIQANKIDTYAPLLQKSSQLKLHFSTLKKNLNGWQRYLSTVDSHVMDFDHYKLMHGEGLIKTSALIRSYIQKAFVATSS